MELQNDLKALGSKPRSLIEKAALIAQAAHAGQVRKDDASPYVVHPYMVALMLTRHGFAEEVVATALVHDVLEDTTMTHTELAELLTEEIVMMVELLSEDKELSWEDRKQKYIEAIRLAPEGVKAVSIADKIHNLDSLLSMYGVRGAEVWKVFNRGREAKTWFETSMLRMFQESWSHPLVEEYAVLVARLHALPAEG